MRWAPNFHNTMDWAPNWGAATLMTHTYVTYKPYVQEAMRSMRVFTAGVQGSCNTCKPGYHASQKAAW